MRGLRQHLAEANKAYLDDADRFKEVMQIEEDVNKAALNRIMQARQRMTHELFAISETAAKKAAEDIPRAIADIEQKISDRQFVEQDISRQEPGNPIQRLTPFGSSGRFGWQASSRLG